MTEIITVRKAWVTTTLPEGRLVLEAMSGHDSLGSPFGYDLSLLSLDPNVNPSVDTQNRPLMDT
jgi:uncharacterized protein involved in type VI secretion and phage assembly